MSEIKVNKISPRTACGTTTLGDSGDSFVIPSGVTITNNGTQTGFGRTGTVDWQTSIKTSTITAVNGEGYFVNTTGGAVTANLPAGTAGSIVAFKDYLGTFDTHALTIAPNGSQKINGDATKDLTVDTEGESLTLVYADDTQGWLVVNDGNNDAGSQAQFITATGGTETTVCTNFKVHTFTGPGTFTVTNAGNAAGSNEVSYMVIAGGAGSGANAGGGGGAGGYREAKSPQTPYTASPLDGYANTPNRISLTAQGYPIVVGGGGAGATGAPARGSNGNPSTFDTITSAGGGGGASSATPVRNGGPGGSGGGARSNISGTGGTGNTPPTNPAQGTNGGATGGCGPTCVGGGGGGAGGAGCSGNPGPGGGGVGTTSSINATPTVRAGGGGGASNASNPGGPAGPGGGGAGANNPGQGTAGTANTGGGAGGSGGAAPSTVGAAGGSGLVIIRYKFQ